MKVQDKQNDPSGLPEKNWLSTRLAISLEHPNMLPMNVSEGRKMHPGAELSHPR